jgi:hypothetical protein
MSGVPERLFRQPTRLVLRHAGVTIIYQENDGHLRKRDKSEQKSHISRETWPDLESAAREFWAGQVTWAENTAPERSQNLAPQIVGCGDKVIE